MVYTGWVRVLSRAHILSTCRKYLAFIVKLKHELFSLCRTVLLKFLNDSLIRYFILFKLKFELLPSVSNTVNKLHNIDDSQRPVLPERHEDAQTFGG